MQNISQLICFIVFSVLVATTTTCMARTAVNQTGADEHLHHSIKKRQNTDCVTATINDTACRTEHCHSTTTHIHNCVDYSLTSDSANYTAHIDICNTTDCRNTTRHMYFSAHDISDRCVNMDIKINSCTNDACRNRTTTIHACESSSVAGAAACAGVDDIDDAAALAASYATCVDGLLAFFRRVLGN